MSTSHLPIGRRNGLAAAYRILVEIVEAAEREAAAAPVAAKQESAATAGRQLDESNRQTEVTPG